MPLVWSTVEEHLLLLNSAIATNGNEFWPVLPASERGNYLFPVLCYSHYSGHKRPSKNNKWTEGHFCWNKSLVYCFTFADEISAFINRLRGERNKFQISVWKPRPMVRAGDPRMHKRNRVLGPIIFCQSPPFAGGWDQQGHIKLIR